MLSRAQEMEAQIYHMSQNGSNQLHQPREHTLLGWARGMTCEVEIELVNLYYAIRHMYYRCVIPDHMIQVKCNLSHQDCQNLEWSNQEMVQLTKQHWTMNTVLVGGYRCR